MLAQYVRNGGEDPTDDEWLKVQDDGTFTLARTNAIGAVGRFAGSLPAEALDALRREVEAVPAGQVVEERGTSPTLTETIDLTDASLFKSEDEDAPDGWVDVVAHLRALVDDLVDQPVAALTMDANADGTEVELTVIGTEPLEADLNGASAVVHLFHGEEWEASTTVPLDLSGLPTTLDPGWSATVAVAHGYDLKQGDSVNVAIRVRLHVAGIWNDGNLAVIVDR